MLKMIIDAYENWKFDRDWQELIEWLDSNPDLDELLDDETLDVSRTDGRSFDRGV